MVMIAKQENKARKTANGRLADMSSSYHQFIPTSDIDAILTEAGFNSMEPAIYCGREGRVNEQVGQRTWITMSWYKMEETGRFEIVAYLS